MRVLVLDDDDIRHEGFSEHFKGHDIKHVYTFEDCVHALEHLGPWDVVYLDHDLNDHGYESKDHNGYTVVELTGADVCAYIRRLLPKEKHPPKVIVHSWNPPGAKMMIDQLRDVGIPCSYQPYEGTSKKLLIENPFAHHYWSREIQDWAPHYRDEDGKDPNQ